MDHPAVVFFGVSVISVGFVLPVLNLFGFLLVLLRIASWKNEADRTGAFSSRICAYLVCGVFGAMAVYASTFAIFGTKMGEATLIFWFGLGQILTVVMLTILWHRSNSQPR
jgi:hypothetical protein